MTRPEREFFLSLYMCLLKIYFYHFGGNPWADVCRGLYHVGLLENKEISCGHVDMGNKILLI